MCLEWALRCDESTAETEGDGDGRAAFTRAIWDWELASADPGSVVVGFAVPSSSEDAQERDVDQLRADLADARREWVPPAKPEPRDVARALSAVEVRVPDESEALALLADVVSFARYWQEPDERDLAAALPDLREPLHRVAEALASAPSTAWWTSPMDRGSQWAQTFVEVGRQPEPERAAADVLGSWRGGVAETERTSEEWYQTHDGRFGGDWWSMPGHQLASTTRAMGDGAPAGLWCVEDSMDPDRVLTQRIEVPADARVVEIAGPGDWIELCREHPVDVTWSRRGVWSWCTGRTGAWVVPDWRALADQGVAAVRLSAWGYLTTAGRALDLGDGRASVVAGWDPDRTFWLCDVTPVGDVVAWETDDSGPDRLWRRGRPGP